MRNPVTRDALWFGLYTGMHREEVLTLRWERIDIAALTFRVEETKTGEPLELPLTRQLAALLERRRAVAGGMPERARPGDVTEGYAADWTVEQLRAHAQKVADRIDELMRAEPNGAIEPAPPVEGSGGP